ncbi:MAG: hypothetical protein ACW981_08900 [Candidatus Hodarchaeales archaeon]|jgi:tetratricopeptide (TPR) repeat protein
MDLYSFRIHIFHERFDKVKENLQSTSLNSIESLIIESELLENQNKLDGALQAIDKAILLSKEKQDQYCVLISLIQKTSILVRVEQLKKKEIDKNYDHIFDLFKDIERNIKKSPSELQEELKYWSRRLYSLFGIVYWEKESQHMANNYFQRSLDIANALHDNLSVFVVLNNTTIANYRQVTIMPSSTINKELEELESNFKVASSIAHQLSPSMNLLYFYNNASQFYSANKNLKLAGQMNERGSVIAKQMGLDWPLVDQLGNSKFFYTMLLW